MILSNTPDVPNAPITGTKTLFSPAGPLASRTALVRLRVSAVYPSKDTPASHVLEWFWAGQGQEGLWTPERARSVGAKEDGKPHVYWIFLRADEAGQGLTGLRFDPVNGKVQTTIEWIALDEVR